MARVARCGEQHRNARVNALRRVERARSMLRTLLDDNMTFMMAGVLQNIDVLGEDWGRVGGLVRLASDCLRLAGCLRRHAL